MKRVLAICFIFILISCSSEFGNKIIGGELTVYYIEESDVNKAEKVAIFWKENQLLSGEKQDIQLIKNDKGYVLKLISDDLENTQNMSFDERKLLLDLQKSIKDTIFPDNSLELVICNSKFEPIYNLN